VSLSEVAYNNDVVDCIYV